jgi:hypothetical protein
VKQIDPTIQYPFDTTTLPSPDEAKTEWSNGNNKNAIYIFNVTCLDTLDYGIYLNPGAGDKNARIPRRVHHHDTSEANRRPPEVSINTFLLDTKFTFN